MKLFSLIDPIVCESVLTVPYINIGGQWDSSHHKLSQLKGTVKGQMGQFNDTPLKNLSSLKGQKSKKGHILTAQEIVQKKHLSPRPGTVQNREIIKNQKGKGKGLIPSIIGKEIMSSNSYYVNFSKMHVTENKQIIEMRFKWDNYFNYGKKLSRFCLYMGIISHFGLFLRCFWTLISQRV